jgi:hypothetical protein
LVHESRISGKGTPLVVCSKNPEVTPKEKHYPSAGIVLGLTAVTKEPAGQVPIVRVI